MHGAAEASLSAAAVAVRAELQAVAPAPEKATLEAPSLQLAEDMLGLARRLAAVAAGSAARCGLCATELPGFKVGRRTQVPVLCKAFRMEA